MKAFWKALVYVLAGIGAFVVVAIVAVMFTGTGDYGLQHTYEGIEEQLSNSPDAQEKPLSSSDSAQ